MVEPRWRDVGEEFRAEHEDRVTRIVGERLRYGMEQHGPVFEGEPLTHLAEELVDALFYADVARQRIIDLVSENNVLRDEVDKLRRQRNHLR